MANIMGDSIKRRDLRQTAKLAIQKPLDRGTAYQYSSPLFYGLAYELMIALCKVIDAVVAILVKDFNQAFFNNLVVAHTNAYLWNNSACKDDQ